MESATARSGMAGAGGRGALECSFQVAMNPIKASSTCNLNFIHNLGHLASIQYSCLHYLLRNPQIPSLMIDSYLEQPVVSVPMQAIYLILVE